MHRHGRTYLVQLAIRVFGDEAQATAWLDRPSVQLGGRSPREILAKRGGARRVEELLAQIADDDRLHRGAAPGGR
ncbi:MAG: MbcA/ParS/Xre antitoxin family protein [Burkholderiales bacterium]|nr:MbcA/ParS/Xre antitoxin family protein [Burkholderiales bacterium]